MKIKIIKYQDGKTALFERYTSNDPVEGYDDLTQLWRLKNAIMDIITVDINGSSYTIVRRAFSDLITDKASTPFQRSDWYPARRAYIWHDVDFTLHNLAQFSENNDDGFRATNAMFLADIDYHIRQARKMGMIGVFRAFLWHIKKRLWYRAVSSIAGQGRYVANNTARGNHRGFSEISIEEVK